MAAAKTFDPPERLVRDNTFTQFLVIFCLSGFTITEPILTIFGANPGLFYFHNIDSALLIALYALMIALLPALGIWLPLCILGFIHRPTAIAFYHCAVAALAGLWLLQLGKWSLDIVNPVALALLTFVGGISFLVAYLRVPIIKSWLKFAAIVPLAFIGIFLLSSPVSSLTKPSQASDTIAEPAEKLPSVLFIMLDEFPTAGLFNEQYDIDKARFPALWQLSQQSTWYRHYTVLAGKTDLSVPSILSGSFPRPVVPSYANFPNNLFSLLEPTHHLTVFESLTGLCGLPSCGQGPPGKPIETAASDMAGIMRKSTQIWLRRVSLLDTSGALLDDFQDNTVAQESQPEASSSEAPEGGIFHLFNPANQVSYAQKKPARLAQFMRTMAPTDESALYFLHVELPHGPYRFYPSGQLYDLSYARSLLASTNDDGDWMARLSEYRFTLQAQYTDRLLGEIFDQLKASNKWDDTLVVVTADHGRSFKPNTSRRLLQPETLDTTVYAPLFIKAPKQHTGRIDDSNLMAMDVLPTITNILGIEPPRPLQGLPAGHVGIAARGDQKFCFPRDDREKFGDRSLEGRYDFSDKEHFPDFNIRQIGSLEGTADSLELLNAELGLERFIGRPSSAFPQLRGGRTAVEELDFLQQPTPGAAPMGVVMGNLEFQPGGDRVVIAINGTILTGSPLFKMRGIDNTFAAMLPAGSVVKKNEVEIFLVEDEHLVKLELYRSKQVHKYYGTRPTPKQAN